MYWGTAAATILLFCGPLLSAVGLESLGALSVAAGSGVFIALPLLRIILMFAVFALERDALYTAITLLVVTTITGTAIAAMTL